MKRLKKKIQRIASLKDNWDGYGACRVCGEVVRNTIGFVEFCPTDYLEMTDADSVVPTPYGSITLDFENSAGELVSFEIGREKMGWFSKFRDGRNYDSDGTDIREGFPEDILVLLYRLKNR